MPSHASSTLLTDLFILLYIFIYQILDRLLNQKFGCYFDNYTLNLKNHKVLQNHRLRYGCLGLYKPLASYIRILVEPNVLLAPIPSNGRSEEHTSELQSRPHLVCRLLLEKKKKKKIYNKSYNI